MNDWRNAGPQIEAERAKLAGYEQHPEPVRAGVVAWLMGFVIGEIHA